MECPGGQAEVHVAENGGLECEAQRTSDQGRERIMSYAKNAKDWDTDATVIVT